MSEELLHRSLLLVCIYPKSHGTNIKAFCEVFRESFHAAFCEFFRIAYQMFHVGCFSNETMAISVSINYLVKRQHIWFPRRVKLRAWKPYPFLSPSSQTSLDPQTPQPAPTRPSVRPVRLSLSTVLVGTTFFQGLNGITNDGILLLLFLPSYPDAPCGAHTAAT